jgi:galactosamine-6-phosphate isomerase
MNIYIADTKEELSKKIASDIIESLRPIEHPLICTASGDSPAGLYQEMVQRVSKNELDISGWKFVGLDEWTGMNENDEGSCKYHLNKQFYGPLKIAPGNICFFDGRAKDLRNECTITEKFIQKNGGIDIAIVGLGLNGHIGMNEPGTSISTRTHVSAIDPLTQKTGQKYFTRPQQLTHGITLGLANLMEAKQVVLIVTGAHKADIVQKVLGDEISEQLPASLFRNHPGFKVYLDKAAAQQLISK